MAKVKTDKPKKNMKFQPNWPPAPGEQYAPPIAENNVRAGWTPHKAVENNRIADEKQERDLVKCGLV